MNSFLQELLQTVQGGLNARLKFNELESGVQAAMLFIHQELKDKLTEENRQVCINLNYVVLFAFFQ